MNAPPKPSPYRQLFDQIVQKTIESGASDVHIKVGLQPMIRHLGALKPLGKEWQRLKPEEVVGMVQSVLPGRLWSKLEDMEEVDVGVGIAGVGRFRVNAFKQRGTLAMVIRSIPYEVKTLEELRMPAVLKQLANEARGLILVTGATGSGKSTTLAAIVEHINSTRTSHIVTVEDPIEFLIRDRRSIITQRELNLDTKSFALAMKHALRQDPDVILVGEMRDQETMHTAMVAAETGHLVMSTLHTNNATESINRILSSFPPHQNQQIRIQMAATLRAVVSQRLVERADGKGLVAAIEILIVNSRVREMIVDPKRTHLIQQAIEESASLGMQSFDQHLISLVKEGVISYQVALENCSNAADFELRARGVSGMGGEKWNRYDGGISLVQDGEHPTATPPQGMPQPPSGGIELETIIQDRRLIKKKA